MYFMRLDKHDKVKYHIEIHLIKYRNPLKREKSLYNFDAYSIRYKTQNEKKTLSIVAGITYGEFR